MTNAELVLACANVVQTIALAWIVAWQQRARYVVQQLNGDLRELRDELQATRELVAPELDASSSH